MTYPYGEQTKCRIHTEWKEISCAQAEGPSEFHNKNKRVMRLVAMQVENTKLFLF